MDHLLDVKLHFFSIPEEMENSKEEMKSIKGNEYSRAISLKENDERPRGLWKLSWEGGDSTDAAVRYLKPNRKKSEAKKQKSLRFNKVINNDRNREVSAFKCVSQAQQVGEKSREYLMDRPVRM
ncbi:hypothetical protein RUM43_005730 [Polyplax serrata]|uniref:Uncharacterized protein n=1 Tax=Polyplax serrata TaxID=468196 RepID=A0AAN8NWJ6_POLSC